LSTYTHFADNRLHRSLLEIASVNGHLSMLTLLLDQGVQLDEEVLFETHYLQIIKYLVKRGANPKATDNNGNTLLHCFFAVENKDFKHFKYLFRNYSADVSPKNNKGETPLHLACKGGRYINNLKMVKFLIEEQKADPAVTCDKGKTALHYAAQTSWVGHPSILRYLIEEQKVNPANTCNEGKTAFHYAAENCSLIIWKSFTISEATNTKKRTFPTQGAFCSGLETQKYLLEFQQKIIEAKDKKGKTALHYLLEKYQKEESKVKFFKPVALILASKVKILHTKENKHTDHIFDWIKQSYDSGIKKITKEDDKVTISCFVAGLQSFQQQLTEKFEKEKHIQYNPFLYIVLYCKRIDIAEFILNQDLCYIEKQCNAEEANSKIKLLLESYLRFSCTKGFLDLACFLLQEINNRQELIQHLNFDGKFLETACRKKHINVFQYLLEDEKAKDEAAEFLKDFPLHYACSNGLLEMVQYMIESGLSDFEAKDTDGQTLLYLALEMGSIQTVQYLLEEKRACINETNKHGRSVFQAACKSGSLELIKYIQEKFKPDINAQDDNGLTALHVACTRWNLGVVKFLITDMKANLHSVDKEGKTPLHVAGAYNNYSIAKFLVKKGADVLAKDNSRNIPLQIARRELNPFLKAATKR
jgi:ankyrin repeat protein